MGQPSIDELFGTPVETPNMPEIAEKDLAKLATKYLAADALLADLEDRAKQARKEAERAELQLLDAMQAAGMKSFRLATTGQLLTSSVKHRFALPPKSNAEDRTACLRWLSRVGGKDLVQEDIHPSTLTAFLRERLEKGKPCSPVKIVNTVNPVTGQEEHETVTLIKDTPFRYLSVRKGD